MIDRIDALLEELPGTRAEQITAAIRALAKDTAYRQILLCELTYEAWKARAWEHVVNPVTGHPYSGPSVYFREAWGLHLRITSLRWRKGLGQSVRAYPAGQREWLRQELAVLGLSKALLFITPIRTLGTAEALQPWLQQARLLTKRELDKAMKDIRRPRTVVPIDTRCPVCGKPRGRKAMVTA